MVPFYLLFLIIKYFFWHPDLRKFRPTTPSKFFEYAANGDIEKIDIINQREALCISDKRMLHLKDEHRDSASNNINAISMLQTDPNYRFEFGDLQNFENKLDTSVNEENNQNIEVNYIY